MQKANLIDVILSLPKSDVMARKRRIEREDAIYHVFNRGNYRRFIFETVGARKAFQKALFEAKIRFDWELYGYTIMGNHFHLALRTPRGGLSKGMQWLGGTFAVRFNRYRREQGRLYQGPFKALLVEPGMHLLRLIDYIHLNPLVAGLEDEGSIGDYTWGSLNAFLRGDVRKEFLSCKWMMFGDGLEDSPTGWQRYVDRLLLRYQTDRDVVHRMEKEMTRGWCIGSDEFKREVGKEFIEESGLLHLSAEDLHDFNRTQWELLEQSKSKSKSSSKSSSKSTESANTIVLLPGEWRAVRFLLQTSSMPILYTWP